MGADPKRQQGERRRDSPVAPVKNWPTDDTWYLFTSGILLYFFTSPKVENPGKSCRMKSFSSQKTVESHTQFPYAGMMNFQLTSQQRLFIFKEEFSILEGVPTGKVFTTWGIHRDWEHQVGLGACTKSLVCQARSRSFPYRGDWKPLRPPDITQVFSVWAGGETQTCLSTPPMLTPCLFKYGPGRRSESSCKYFVFLNQWRAL